MNLDTSLCTYQLTKRTYVSQQWATCYDCFGDKSEGACMYCLNTCHKGHKIGKLDESIFFCDCGANQMCLKPKVTPQATPQALPSFQTASGVNTKPYIMPNYCGTVYNLPTLRNYDTIRETSDSNNAFAVKLYDAADPDSVYSPLSITYILSLLHHGATSNTDAQLTKVLGRRNTLADLLDISNVFNSDIIKLANAVLVNKLMGVDQSYLDMVGKLALVSNEDFGNPLAVVQKANGFIEQNTKGLIKDILKLEHISMDTLMVLINTIYFKTVWENQFDTRFTTKQPFYANKIVDMMTLTKNFAYFEDDDCQMLEMPYKGKEFCMGFILPKIESNMDLAYYFTDSHTLYKQEIQVHIPKFTHRKNINLVPLLKTMGLTDLFDPAKSKLDGISKAGAYVSVMIHEAVVIVDEAGTEAAAVTVACVTKESCSMSKPIVFNANHSFVYYIKHQPSNTILFVGDYHGN